MAVKLKDYKLRSSGKAKGQLIQIPIDLVREWGMGGGGTVELFKTTTGDLVIRPKVQETTE